MTRVLSGVPPEGTAIPAAVVALASGAPVVPVWVNMVGGVTFRIDRGARDGGAVFVKWNPAGSAESLAAEAERLEWLKGRFAVPEIVASGVDDAGEWLATKAIVAESAVATAWKARPEVAARAMGAGLRRLHETVSPAGCAFEWSVSARIAAAARAGIVVPAVLHEPPPIDLLVVCHGDPCAPNTLIDAAGEFAGIVDVGRLGVADRWADLAVACWSLGWNFGDGYERVFFDSYGVEPDATRIAYYRALWDAT